MQNFVRRIARRLPLHDWIALELVLVYTAAAFFIPGGADTYLVYRKLAEGCLECVYNPWHAYWVFLPMRFVPPVLLYPVWVLLTGLLFFWAAKLLNVNAAVVLGAFPMIAQVWLGQVDLVLAGGLLLALLSPHPYLRGLGLVFMSVKPQVMAPVLLLLILREGKPFQTLLVPIGVFLASLAVWGVTWPVEWLRFILANPHPHVWALPTFFPYGLPLFGLVFLFKDKRDQLTALLLISMLALPRTGVYSYVIFLIFLAPWWAVPLSYAWLIAFPWLGNEAMRFAWVLPAGLLIHLCWPHLKAWWLRLRRSGDLPAAEEV